MLGTAASDEIATVRAFNRFYTRQCGLLDEVLLHSPFSLTEARVLYELAHHDGLVATSLCNDLGLDAGYLSRLLKRFEANGLVTRTAAGSDARQSVLALTEAGRAAFQPLDRASHGEISAMLDTLSATDRRRLTAAMTTIRTLLGDRTFDRERPFTLRPHRCGDMGWITHRQAVLYHQEYGWDETFEALVAQITSDFIKSFDPKRECCWIAERGGEIVGSVFAVRESDETAKLRLLYVEPSARGLGIGHALVDECIGFARAKGYKTLTLWTNDILIAARRIYEAAGFTLTGSEDHHSFGKSLVGQYWTLDL